MKEIYHLDANILQVRPDTFTGILWIVKGDLSEQKLMFLNIPEGTIEEWNKAADIPVGFTLKEVLNGVLIFSQLKDPAYSDSNRILCIDSESGEVIYDEMGWYFERIKDKSNFIIKRPFQDRIEYKELELEDIPQKNSFSSELLHPKIIHESNPIHKDISLLFEGESENLYGAIEILELKHLIFTSFHKKVGEKMSKLVCVLNEKAQIINTIEIATELDKYIEESFFVWGNFVIFVQEKVKLRFLNLDIILL